MEAIIKNPGLQHIAEEICFNLSYEHLKNFLCLNQSTKQISKNPFFWLKKLIQNGLLKKNQQDWTKAIQLTENSKLKKCIISYLKRIIRAGHHGDIPCFIDEKVVEMFSNEYRFINVFYGRQYVQEEIQMGVFQLLAGRGMHAHEKNS